MSFREKFNRFWRRIKPVRRWIERRAEREARDWARRKVEELENRRSTPPRDAPARGVGHSVPLPHGERNGDGEPSETYIMPDWSEIEKPQ